MICLFCKLLVSFLMTFQVILAKSIDLRSLLNINKKLEMMEHEEMESRTGADLMTNMNDDVANDKKYNKEIWKLMRKSTGPFILNDDESDIDYDDRFSEELSKLSKNPREEVIWEEPTVKSPDCWQVAMYGGTIASYSPSCSVYGGYTAKQCYLERCWCVNKIGQPMKKIYDENGEVSWKFLEWRDGVDSGIDDSYFTYGYKAIKLDCESLFAEYKLYYLAKLEKKIREILSSTGNPSETIVHDLPATNYQEHLGNLHKELTSPSSNTGTQTNNARSLASHNSATTTATQVGDSVKFEAKTEVQAPYIKLQNLSVQDEETFSQRNHDQKPNVKTLTDDTITTVANVAINGSHLKENLTSDRTEIYVESDTPGNIIIKSQSFASEIATNLTNPSNGIR